jgi:energy-coupling factor transporter ATP-binding protein EcfA2
MLKRLYIDNFRCFVNFEYKPERKQLLLGANGSGKSSLLDAVRLLKGFLRDERVDAIRSSFWSGRTRWLDLPKQVFEIEAELGGDLYIYRLELQFERIPSWRAGVLADKVGVLAESLKVNGTPIAEILDGQAILYPRIPGSSEIRLHQLAIPEDSIIRAFGGYSEEIKTFVEWISDLPLLNIDPHEMGRAERLPGRPRLAKDMWNIADWYKLQTVTDIESVIRLSVSLKEVLEGFESLNFRDAGPDHSELIATFKGPKSTVDFRFRELSDGQRCLIALYMILHFLIAKGQTVFLDEPDNFISLREIQPWLVATEDAVNDSKGQLILISHHPEILNRWSLEYGVYFVREGNGQVRPPAKFKTDYDGVLQPSEVIARGWEDE